MSAYLFITKTRPFCAVARPGPGSRWLLGYGMCWHEGENRMVQKGDTVDKRECKRWLRKQIKRFQPFIVGRCGVILEMHELIALTSLVVELGTRWFETSEIAWSMREGDRTRASAWIEMSSYDAAAKHKHPIIVNHNLRIEERRLFDGVRTI